MSSAQTQFQAPLFTDEVNDTSTTPAMAQYLELKNAHQDCLLFYRMGDFYEMFFEDAQKASTTLGIALTKRGKHKGEDIPMAGVPVHAADEYLQKLIAHGHRVAVAEQMENPAEAKKRGSKSIVRRDVVRLITPGTVTEEKLLDSASSCFLCALVRTGKGDSAAFALARLDLSTGEFVTGATSPDTFEADLARIAPREILVSDDLYDQPQLRALLQTIAPLTPLADVLADSAGAERKLTAFFKIGTLDSFGKFTRAELGAAGLVLNYIERTQREAAPRLKALAREVRGGFVEIDPAARASLELTKTQSGEKKGSLLGTIDMTLTAIGGRLLAQQLGAPLTSSTLINERLDAVEALLKADAACTQLRTHLRTIPDMARALSRLSLQRAGPRDLGQIRAALSGAVALQSVLKATPSLQLPSLKGFCDALTLWPPSLLQNLQDALEDELPHLQRDGGFVRKTYSAALDAQRQFRDQAQHLILGLQHNYIALTGIKNLKIRHNNMLGYFIETGAQHADMMRSAPLQDTFIHRQTLASQSRFSTKELSDIEARIFGAADAAQKIEDDIFSELRNEILAAYQDVMATSDAIAALDVASSLATLAQTHNFTRPVIDDSLSFHIEGGRHVVVEEALRRSGAPPFIANDCDLSTGAIWLLTGPNMAGKSTFLRQNALIAVMAQMGSFVPARAAHIGVIDRLYSRVGAADDLARGRSTFMVEMVETAAILNQATARSLVILDEIGRGTATFDGLSIAWACVEHLHDVSQCRALFATHFHELTALEARLPRLANMSMQVKEWQSELVFLHTIGTGVADGSYGLQVAKLAGLPASVLSRARDVLEQLEQSQPSVTGFADTLAAYEPQKQHDAPDLLAEFLTGVDPDTLSPREALDALYKIKQLNHTKPASGQTARRES